MKEDKQLDSGLLYEVRVAIMLETAPQSNTYQQIMFDKETFKEVSDFIRSKLPKCNIHDHPDGNHCMSIITNNENECKLPSELKTSYPIEQIQ